MSNSDDQNQPGDLAEEQRTIESQERETEPAQTQAEEPPRMEEPKTTTSVEQVNEILESSKEKQPKARQEDSTRKLFNQFSKHFQISKIASDKTANILKQRSPFGTIYIFGYIDGNKTIHGADTRFNIHENLIHFF